MTFSFYHDKEDEVNEPWDTRGCYSSSKGAKKQFVECAKCGHHFIDWVRKAEIDELNKQHKRTFDKLIADYNEKKQRGVKGLKKPIVDSVPLLIRCNCHKNYHAAYNNKCPNKCGDGTCELCNCSCSFIVTVANYNAVKMASINPQHPMKSHGSDEDDAREFLKLGARVRKSAAEDAKEAYGKMISDGRLDRSQSGRNEIAASIERQASLITAQHYVNNPPAHGARCGLQKQINKLEHAKGASWIKRNGIDVNLGGYGDKRRTVNNRLTSVVELLEESDDDDISIHAVSGSKGSSVDSSRRISVARKPHPAKLPLDIFSSPVEKMIMRTRSWATKMMLDNDSDKQGWKKTCTVLTALANHDSTYLSIVEDILLEAAGSQDVLNACLMQASLEQNN